MRLNSEIRNSKSETNSKGANPERGKHQGRIADLGGVVSDLPRFPSFVLVSNF